jgi:hypothetical protein
MTESEWLASTDVREMTKHLHAVNADSTPGALRKECLFGVASCERVRHLLAGEPSRDALDALAGHAEDPFAVTVEEEERVCELAWAGHADTPRDERDPTRVAAWGVINVSQGLHWLAAVRAAEAMALAAGEPGDPPPQRTAVFATLFRCIFGNPFRPVAAARSWLTPTVVSLAEAIYADRAFDRLPVLADALEEAGCGDDEILNHCRGGGVHVRGCWVVDLVLGK